jgi:hypothetical protein
MSEQNIQSMYDIVDPALKTQGQLNEFLADEKIVMDRATKTRVRKQVNLFKDMFTKVTAYQDDLTEDVIEGMKEVIVNTEAKLDGKPMSFKADMETAA